MGQGYYDVMQVCENGHMINDMVQSWPQRNKEFCTKCGSKTTICCPECNTAIRGCYHARYGLGGTPKVPSFCHACGKPYPWTAKKLDAARELAEETEGLEPDEVEKLKGSLDDLIRETPKTPVAAVRFKKLVAKAGAHTAQAFRDILVDVVSEAAKKAIWPQ